MKKTVCFLFFPIHSLTNRQSNECQKDNQRLPRSRIIDDRQTDRVQCTKTISFIPVYPCPSYSGVCVCVCVPFVTMCLHCGPLLAHRDRQSTFPPRGFGLVHRMDAMRRPSDKSRRPRLRFVSVMDDCCMQ